MAGPGSHGGGGNFASLNNQLQAAVTNFAALTSGASAFGAAINTFRLFERQLTLTNAVAGGTAAQFRQMEDAARSFALASATSATEAASALYFLAAAGFSVSDSLTTMNAVLTLSQATLTDVAFTSDVLASNIQAFGLEAADATRIANVFAASMSNSMASMDKLAFAMRQVAPAAAAVGQSVEETTAQLSELFNIGLRGEQAGTQLRNLIVRLARPVGEARDLLREMGIQTTDAYGELRNLRDVLIEIGNAGFTTSELSAIFGVEGVAGGIALINSAMSGSLDDMEATITGTNRAFEMFAETLDTFDGAARQARNAIDELFIEFGGAVAGPLGDLALMFRDLVIAFRQLDEETKTFIVTTGAMVAGLIAAVAAFRTIWFIMAPLAIGVGKLTAAIAMSIPFIATYVNTIRTLMALNAASFGAGLIGTFRNFGLAVASAVPLVSNLVTWFGALAGTTLSPAAMGLVAVGTALGGVAVAGGLVYAVYQLWQMWKNAGEAAVEAGRQQILAATGADDVISRLAGDERTMGSVEGVDIAERRLDQARRLYTDGATALDLLTALSGVVRNRLDREAGNIEEAIDAYRTSIQDSMDTGFEFTGLAEAIYRTRQELDRVVEERRSKLTGSELDLFDPEIQALDERMSILGARLRSLMDSIGSEDLENQIEAYIENVVAGQEQLARIAELRGQTVESYPEIIGNFLNAMIGGDVDISAFAPDQAGIDAIRNFLDANQQRMTDALVAEVTRIQQEGGVIDLRRVMEIVGQQATEAGDTDVMAIFEALNAQAVEYVNLAMDALNQQSIDISRELAESIMTGQASLTDTVANRIAASDLRERNRFIDAMRRVGEERASTVSEAFGDSQLAFATVSREIMQYRSVNNPQELVGQQLGELLSMQGVYDAVARQAEQGASPEELEAFVQGMVADRMIAIQMILLNLVAADKITEATMQQVMESAQAAADTVALAIAAFQNAVEVGRTRAADVGGGGGRDPAEEAKRLRRQYEDAFEDLRQIGIDARRTMAEMGQMDFGVRLNLMLELDIADINQQYDEQITRLQRELEDINETFQGQPLELEALRNEYTEMIALVEQARQAELAYTNTFSASVERRNAAIQAQIEQLRTLGAESNNIADQFTLGLQAGILQYQMDMVSTVDNVANAVVGAMDAFANAFAQWATGQGDFIDVLRQGLLSVTQEFLQNAIRGLLQSLLSNLTSGLAQGAGGALGQAVASLFGGGGGMAGGAAGAAGAAGQMAGMTAALTSLTVGMQTAFTSFLTQLNVILVQFTTQFQIALQAAIARMSFGGIPMMDAGGTIGTGQLAIVGERGPEFVRGPASVTGRVDTARLLQQAMASGSGQSSESPVINVTNVVVGTEEEAREYMNSPEAERQIMNIIDRRRRG